MWWGGMWQARGWWGRGWVSAGRLLEVAAKGGGSIRFELDCPQAVRTHAKRATMSRPIFLRRGQARCSFAPVGTHVCTYELQQRIAGARAICVCGTCMHGCLEVAVMAGRREPACDVQNHTRKSFALQVGLPYGLFPSPVPCCPQQGYAMAVLSTPRGFSTDVRALP